MMWNQGNIGKIEFEPDEGAFTCSWEDVDNCLFSMGRKYEKIRYIVDVRRQDEYDSGHIPGAILIPNESLGTEKPEKLPEFDQVILIYCRSGNRSKAASQKLADMGYTNIYEFGGIIDWNGEIVTSE